MVSKLCSAFVLLAILIAVTVSQHHNNVGQSRWPSDGDDLQDVRHHDQQQEFGMGGFIQPGGMHRHRQGMQGMGNGPGRFGMGMRGFGSGFRPGSRPGFRPGGRFRRPGFGGVFAGFGPNGRPVFGPGSNNLPTGSCPCLSTEKSPTPSISSTSGSTPSSTVETTTSDSSIADSSTETITPSTQESNSTVEVTTVNATTTEDSSVNTTTIGLDDFTYMEYEY